MEDGDVALFLQLALDFKAPGGGDVLQVDAAEGAGDVIDSLNEFVHVLRLDTQREGVHSAEGLEQHALALHHGHARLGADIPQPQHRGAVGNHGAQVVPPGEPIALADVLLNFQAGLRYAGGIGQGQRLLAVRRHSGHHFNFSLPLSVQAQGLLCIIHIFDTPFPRGGPAGAVPPFSPFFIISKPVENATTFRSQVKKVFPPRRLLCFALRVFYLFLVAIFTISP